MENIDLFTKAYKDENKRRKQQATLEFVTQIRNSSWDLEINLKNKITNEVVDLNELDNSLNITIAKFLSLTEKLATGVNMNVYDFEVVSRLIGYHLVSMYNFLAPYIENRRTDGKSSPLYSYEYEYLKDKILDKKINILDKY